MCATLKSWEIGPRDEARLGLNIPKASRHEQNSSSTNSTLEELGPTYRFENCDPPEDLQYDVWHPLGVDHDQQQKEGATFSY